jgi:protein gp37
MAGTSAIEWTEATWNPVTGCDRVSPGCAHCYALDLAARLKRMGQPRYQRDGDPKTSGPGFGLTLHEDKLDEPLRWRKPRVVFVNSMSDLFHEEIPDDFIARVWDVMVRTPQHTYQILTKRPARMARVLGPSGIGFYAADGPVPCPQPNIWLGVSIENRRFVHRADLLRETPAAVRFVSAEPLLGPLVARFEPDGALGEWVWPDGKLDMDVGSGLDLAGIDWLIVGGESGARHRPIRPEWVRDLRDAAEASGTAFFFKQWGGRTPKSRGRELDGRTWDEMPISAGGGHVLNAVPHGQGVLA